MIWTKSWVDLPAELMRHVYAFMDIPMLGTMAQVHSAHLRNYACEDLVWSKLAKRRFGISTARPKACGGKNWKDAYRCMHLCHRLPKCRATNRKALFAKGVGVSAKDANEVTFMLNVWVGVNHTDNCRTRVLRTRPPPAAAVVPVAAGLMNGGAADQPNDGVIGQRDETSASRQYLDLWVCLQNPQSNGASIRVDILQSTIQLLSGIGELYSEPCLQEDYYTSCGEYRYIMPRLIYKSKQKSSTRASAVLNGSDDDDVIADGIFLKPMEYCVVSIPFACGQDVFETDALARAVAFQIPFFLAENSLGESKEEDMQMDDRSCLSSRMMKLLPSPSAKATAWFISEGDIWEQYCELPGGCVTLSDRDRRMHV